MDKKNMLAMYGISEN